MHGSMARPALATLAAFGLGALACGGDATGPGPGMPVAYATGGTMLKGLAAQDVLGDSRRDLITIARSDGSVRVLPGRGGGTFAGPVSLTAGDDPFQAAAGDVNGDGIPDLLVIGHLVNAFYLRLGEGGGQFAPAVRYPLRNHGNRLVVADLNADGFADVVASHDGSGQPIYVTAFLGSASGELRQAWELGTPYFTTTGIAAGDFDGDGKTDVAIATSDNRAAVLVLKGLGTGEFAAPLALPPLATSPDVSDGTRAIAAGDLNGDGLDDIVVACFELTNQLLVRLSTGSGFADPKPLPLPSPVDVGLGDLNGDGKPDLAAPNLAQGTVSLLYGHGDGSFEPPVDVPMGPDPASVVVADFDGNRLADIAVASLTEDAIRVVLNPVNGAAR